LFRNVFNLYKKIILIIFKKNKKMNHPDPKRHQTISFAKSAIRIIASISLMGGSLVAAGFGFILAEVLGIIEELV